MFITQQKCGKHTDARCNLALVSSWNKVFFQGHLETIFDCKFCPSNPNHLATASFDGTIKVWDIMTMQTVSARQWSVSLSLWAKVFNNNNEVLIQRKLLVYIPELSTLYRKRRKKKREKKRPGQHNSNNTLFQVCVFSHTVLRVCVILCVLEPLNVWSQCNGTSLW